MATRDLAQLVEAELGVRTFTRDNPVTTTVGVTAQQILRQNPNRVAALIVNLSANNIFVGPFQDVATTKGIFAAPSGGSVSLWYKEDYDIVGREWFAVAALAGSAVLIIEWLTQREPK